MKRIIAMMFICLAVGTLSATVPACFKELQQEAFPYNRVTQAFDTANVYQSSWSTIYSQLQTAKSQIPGIIQQQASQMYPNPLNDPFQPQIAVELLRRAEYSVFYQVMNTTQFNNVKDIKQMFNFIFQEHAAKIYSCLGVDIINMQKIPD